MSAEPEMSPFIVKEPDESMMMGIPIKLEDEKRKWEAGRIRVALGQASGKVAAAARLLGIHRTALYEKMRRLGIN